MPIQELTQYQRGVLRGIQIIALALILGVMLLLAVAVIVGRGRQPGQIPEGVTAVLVWLSVGVAAVMIVLRFLVPRLSSEAQVRRIAAGEDPLQALRSSAGGRQVALLPPPNPTPGDKLFPVYLGRMLLGMALLEAAAFFALIVHIVTGHEIPLATAIGLLVLQVFSFPTRTRVSHWVETQLETHEFVDSRSTLNHQP